MVAYSRQRTSRSPQSLEQLLLAYLVESTPGRIPGCEGLTTQEMLSSYRQFAGQGLVPDCERLQRWHPEWADQLQEFLSDVAIRWEGGLNALAPLAFSKTRSAPR